MVADLKREALQADGCVDESAIQILPYSQESMKRISATDAVVPSLALRANSLSPCALSRIDAARIARPAAHLTDAFWSAIDLLHRTLTAFEFHSLVGVALSSKKREILSNVELTMHRCVALNDYLGKLLHAALPASGSKNRAARDAKKRLDYRIEKRCKMPVNLIKHSSFSMSWLEMSQGMIKTHGYCVTGPIGQQTYAPVKFRPNDSGSPEGYSFALTLRETLLAIFDMADIAEEALTDAGLFGSQTKEAPARHVTESILLETLNLLNGLPLYGFPDEHQMRVPIFSFDGDAIWITTKPLRKLPGPIQIEAELRSIAAGASYKMPYFSGSA